MTESIPRLLAITDRHGPSDLPFDRWLDELATAGVDGVQIRDKTLPDADLLALARGIRGALPEDIAVLINGRLDIAVAARCQGVHLPSDGVPAAALRRGFGDRFLIGCSTHHLAEVEAARDAGADYVSFGPIYPTPSKAAYGPPPGLAGLRRAVASGLPVLALGGISHQRIAETLAAGAWGVAAIRLFQDPAELALLRRDQERPVREDRTP